MTEQEGFLRELDHIERQITALQDYLCEAELYPEQLEPWARLRRAVSLFLTRRYVLRQVQQLHLRRRIIHNCYLYVHKREPEDRPVVESSGTVRTYHP